MAHFARIDNGVVQEVIVVANAALDPQDEEASGLAVLAESGIAGEFVQCSYNGKRVNGQDRGGYPGAGWSWDGQRFTPPNGPTTEAV